VNDAVRENVPTLSVTVSVRVYEPAGSVGHQTVCEPAVATATGVATTWRPVEICAVTNCADRVSVNVADDGETESPVSTSSITNGAEAVALRAPAVAVSEIE
jgi:hypothetical protein